MVVFPLLLVLGCVGLAATWLLGLTHGAVGGHALPHHGALAHPDGAGKITAPTRTPSDVTERAPRLLARSLRILSPLNLFGLLLGAGAAGTACVVLGAGVVVSWIAAIVGALTVRFLVLDRLAKLVFRFASRPAQNLEGCLFQEVHAVTRFNARGEGLVRVQIDGRVEDVLGRLTEGERQKKIRVLRGDRLVVEEIDTYRNRCIVSRG